MEENVEERYHIMLNCGKISFSLADTHYNIAKAHLYNICLMENKESVVGTVS